MARSAHAYVRGSTARFYDWLDTVERVALPEGPAVWICGDCHIGNLGPIANAQGSIDLAIRDFDQTVVGNPVHDLVRLGLSLASAARGSNLPGVVTAQMIEQLSSGYTDAFASGRAARPPERPATVERAMRFAKRRTGEHLSRERVAGASRRLPLGRRFWPVTDAERASVEELVRHVEVRQLLSRSEAGDTAFEVRTLDVAYWMKGCSSLGRLRYAALVDTGSGRRGKQSFCLLDIKEAARAVAPHDRHAGLMPSDNAERVWKGAQAMSPFLGGRMHAAGMQRRSVFVRELLPQDLKLAFDRLDIREATTAAYYLAHVVGTAHARQMDAASRRSWRKELLASHSKVIDAPPWLWTSVVDLVALHEKGYLDHCRRHALTAG